MSMLNLANQPPASGRGGEFMLIIASLVWGGSLPLMKSLLEQVDPPQLLFNRFSLAVLLWLPFVWAKRAEFKAAWLMPGLKCGLILVLIFPIVLLTLQHTSATRAAFIFSLFVILVPLTAFLIFKQKPGGRVMLAAFLALAGSYFLTNMDNMQDLPLNLGDLLGLVAAFIAAAHIMAIGRYAGEVPAFWLNFMQTGCVALTGMVWSLMDGGLSMELSSRGWLEFVSLVVFCTVFCFWAQAWGQSRVSASRAAVIFAMEPVAAAFIAALLLGERLGPWGLFGSSLIIAGAVIVALRVQPQAQLQPAAAVKQPEPPLT